MNSSPQFEFKELNGKGYAHRPKSFPRHRRQDEIELRYRMAQYECNKRQKLKFLWKISLEDFRWLCTQACFYCEGALGKVKFGKGLDRIDSMGHYTMDNVYPCCTTCNRIKGHDLTASEAKVIIHTLLVYRKANA